MTALRVAVVGTGGWGEQHARIFSRRPDTDLVGVCGRDPGRAERRAGAYGTTAFTDLDQMIDQARPELITVCLPNHDHYEVTRRLLDTGIPLLLEKPLVFEQTEAEDLVARAEAAGTFVAINFNHRYAEPYLRLKAAVDAGELGRMIFLSWRFGGEAGPGSSPHANLIETQCHGFDLLEHLAGPVSALTAQFGTAVDDEYRTVALTLAFTSGAVGSFLGSYDSSYAYPDTQRVEVNGSLGRALVDDSVGRLTLSRVGDPTARVWQAGYFDDEARSFHATFDRHVEALLGALRRGDPPPVPIQAGQRALVLAQAAIAAHETGRRIEVPARCAAASAP